jgi:hypothetical protein
MKLSVRSSRSGAPTCCANDIWLHSPYDPEREALRFVKSKIGSAHSSHLLILGPCLDYLSDALRSILPGARVIAVQYSPFFEGKTVGLADASWNPLSGMSLDAFLDATLDEDAISGVSVFEWEPAARAFPEEALLARKAVRASLDRLTSSTATVKASGQKWIANACASFLLVESILELRRSSVPVLIAAAGPSLRESLGAFSSIKGRFATIAVSSALAACRSAGIEPDLVVSTDGGYWSRLHLYPLAGEGSPIATPLTALPSASLYRRATILLLDQGTFAESELLPSLGPALRIPPHGTVSGTALQLAARLTEGPIVAAGLDLASYGDLDHARPHGFDAVLSRTVSRIAPLEGVLWSRGLDAAPQSLAEKPWRTSRALTAYASALALDARALPGRLFRIGPSPLPLPGFASIDGRGLEALAASPSAAAALPIGESLFSNATAPPRSLREAILAERLASWRGLAREASSSMGQGSLPDRALVAELLRSIDIVDYAAARRAILARGDPAPAARELERRCDLFLSALEGRFAQ